MKEFFRNRYVCLLLSLVVIFSVACSAGTEKVSSQVCGIYEEVDQYDGLPINEREGILVELVQKKLPDFFDENFQYLMKLDWKDKPETMERLLGMVDKNDEYVLCQPILDYYSIE